MNAGIGLVIFAWFRMQRSFSSEERIEHVGRAFAPFLRKATVEQLQAEGPTTSLHTWAGDELRCSSAGEYKNTSTPWSN